MTRFHFATSFLALMLVGCGSGTNAQSVTTAAAGQRVTTSTKSIKDRLMEFRNLGMDVVQRERDLYQEKQILLEERVRDLEQRLEKIIMTGNIASSKEGVDSSSQDPVTSLVISLQRAQRELQQVEQTVEQYEIVLEMNRMDYIDF